MLGPETGVVLTTRVVPSGSESPASVKSPPTVELSSVVAFTSLSTTGESLTGITVIVINAWFEIAPELSSIV